MRIYKWEQKKDLRIEANQKINDFHQSGYDQRSLENGSNHLLRRDADKSSNSPERLNLKRKSIRRGVCAE